MDKLEQAEKNLERAFRKTWWDKIVSLTHEYLEVLDRVFYWGPAMRRNYDFDSHGIYDMLYRKLDRMYTCFVKHGHCVWNSNPNNKSMRKLRIARNLAKRLAENDYHTQADEVIAQYGNVRMDFIPIPERSVSRCEFYMERAKPEQQKQALALLHKAHQRDDKQRLDEKAYFFKLLQKYLETWWD